MGISAKYIHPLLNNLPLKPPEKWTSEWNFRIPKKVSCSGRCGLYNTTKQKQDNHYFTVLTPVPCLKSKLWNFQLDIYSNDFTITIFLGYRINDRPIGTHVHLTTANQNPCDPIRRIIIDTDLIKQFWTETWHISITYSTGNICL